MNARVRVVQECIAAVLAVELAAGAAAMWVCGATFSEALVPLGLAWWVATCAIPARRPGVLVRLTKFLVSLWYTEREAHIMEITRSTYKGHGKPETFLYFGDRTEPATTGRLVRVESRGGMGIYMNDAVTGERVDQSASAGRFWAAPAPVESEPAPVESEPAPVRGQVAKVTDTVGTMHGHRAIIFTLITSNLGRHTVTFDFYGAGHIFNGKRYCEIEASALRSAITAGLDVVRYSHYITA